MVVGVDKKLISAVLGVLMSSELGPILFMQYLSEITDLMEDDCLHLHDGFCLFFECQPPIKPAVVFSHEQRLVGEWNVCIY